MLGEHSAVAVTPWLRVLEFVLRSRPGDLWLLLDFKPSLLRSHDGSEQKGNFRFLVVRFALSTEFNMLTREDYQPEERVPFTFFEVT